MSYLCPNCNNFPLKDYVWWVSGRKGRDNWWCAICGEKHDWKQPHRLLVVQTGESIDQAKVFKAHAVPQGLCANVISALKLLANQQEDKDNLIQNIVTNLGEGNRKGLTEGLREFIKIDNERALEVGYLTFTVRESSDELTLRAEEEERWGPPLVDCGMPSVRRCFKASKEKNGEICLRPTKK